MTDRREDPEPLEQEEPRPELVEELRVSIERAAALLHKLEHGLAAAGPASVERVRDLEGRLKRTEADVAELAEQLAAAERHASRLMNLYVATYQLHASLEVSEVEDAIVEIASNLLGVEKLALLLSDEEHGNYRVALSRGLEPDELPQFARAYDGGDRVVDAALEDGVVRVGPFPDSPALAVVPLKVQGEIVGAIVLLRLFGHKPALLVHDREMLDLLSAHAASALLAARSFADTERRLRTLESLVKLARGG